ncbi:AraC family transcriptional regulator [Citrobacter sp. BDA59-3]|uniref:AraC family transcriptional regulator n=1 Tax=Citrobacter sp. BDA59-3 TaxID=2781952 RepID=UPI00187DFE9A|nr:AraC family transcriptional regulator [Citrobacter sp. BDA59-3]QOV70907.1 AraC family transcriptional regulator [Citrobacter sp. BDA59-3]
MDPFTDILNLLSARSYATAGLSADNHWAMTFPGYNGLKFLFIKKGMFWFRLEEEPEWTQLSAGQGLVLTRFTRFLMATDVNIPPAESFEKKRPRVREIVNYGGDENLLLAGKMEIDLTSSDILLNGLPLVLHFNTQTDNSSPLNTFMSLFFQEKVANKPGSVQACDYLMHLIMIEVLRSGYEKSSNGSRLIDKFSDARLNKVLSAIHQEPEKNWSLPELAAISGMSRAGFSRKFKEATGITPLLYLTNWRMRLASKSLRFTRESVKLICFKLGYSSESTFSSTFKRVYGVAPRIYRNQHFQQGLKSDD